MSAAPIDYAALAEQARKSAPVDYAALAEQARKGDTPADSKPAEVPWYKRAANVALGPIMDTLGGGANMTARALLTQATGDPMLYDDIRASQAQGPTKSDSEHPIRYAIKQGIGGAVADTADTTASFTSPVSLALMGAGAASKAAGAVGTLGKVALRTAAPVFAGAGAKQVYDAGTENTPQAWQQRLTGGAMAAGGGAGIAEMAPPTVSQLMKMSPALAERMYQSALKPSVTTPAPKVEAMVKAGLDNNIPISADGVEKLSNLIDNVNNQIAQKIQSNPNAPINKFQVASRLSATANDFANQVNPVKDLRTVSDVGNEFLATQPNSIPAADAQALKVGTYKQLAGKYGEMGNAAMESQKALARGLKEELANAFPELTRLNAEDGKLLDLQPALERAVQRNSNHQIIGIGTPIAGGAAAAVTGSGPVGAVVAVMKAVLDNPNLKSQLAIAISRGSKGQISLSGARSKIAAYSTQLGAVAAGTNKEQTAAQ